MSLVWGFLVYVPIAQALSIDTVRFGTHPDKTRIVLELDQPTDFKAFVLNDPYRIVIDLPAYEWNAGTIKKPKNGLVTDLRTGKLDTITSRLVVDVTKPVAIRSAFTLPASASAKNRLVIDFQVVSANTTTDEKKKFFGELEQQPAINPAAKTTNVNAKIAAPQKIETQTNTITPARKPTETSKVTNPFTPLRKPHIVIDAGHGGQDPGAIGINKAYEKNIALASAKELKKKLESTGRYKVSLTRDRDYYIKLYKRVQIARAKKADLFISIHADSIDDKNVRGASVYTLSNKSSDAQTAKLAARENRSDIIAGVDLTHEDKEVSDILLDLAMRDTMNQSKFFANTVVSTFKNHNIGLLRKPHRYAGFAVLKAPDVPSVLLEIGFMSNRQDAALLARSSYRSKVASALVESINRYFQTVEKNQSQ